MTSNGREYAVVAVRAVLVCTGALVAVAVLYSFAAMPASSAGATVRGLSYLFGTVFFLLALVGAGLGIALPSLLDAGDVLAFGHRQRRCLQGAGGLFAGGFAVGLTAGLLTRLQFGLFLWFVAIVVSALAVAGVLVWRLCQLFTTAVVRLVAEETAG